MIIRQITDVIERFAPLEWQESYDNAGLIVGRPDDEVHKALLAVDVTEEVLDEAEAEGCDLVITHHPIVFRALKRFNSADPVERGEPSGSPAFGDRGRRGVRRRGRTAGSC